MKRRREFIQRLLRCLRDENCSALQNLRSTILRKYTSRNIRLHSAQKFPSLREYERERNGRSAIWKLNAIAPSHADEYTYTSYCVLHGIYENNNVTICWYLCLLLSVCTVLIVKCYHSRALYLLVSTLESQVRIYSHKELKNKEIFFCIFIFLS